MKRVRFLFWVTAGPLAVLVGILAVAHPYLAFTETSGADVLVVEGWMEPDHLRQAADIARKGRYTRIYTTGSVRPFSYYLRTKERICTRMKTAFTGSISIDVSGTDGAGFLLVAGADTLLHVPVGTRGTGFSARIRTPTDSIVLVATNSRNIPAEEHDIFIKYLRINGRDAHLEQDSTWFVHADGTRTEAWPTYAHQARATLIADGLPPGVVFAVPAWGEPDSRSWANASYFNVRARADGIKGFDVVTLGVHARRSRQLFQRACGQDVRVGVISIPDPQCPRRGWWLSGIGWFRMLKEVAGSPEAYAVELTR